MFLKKTPPKPHPFAVFADAVDHHLWQKKALDSFESHSFTGKPGQDRWCSRCTLKLDAGWKNPTLPVPPMCGDPSIPWKAEWGGGKAFREEMQKRAEAYEKMAD